MGNKELSEELTSYIVNEFDKLKDKFSMTYDDFKIFSLGYTMGIISILKTNIKQ